MPLYIYLILTSVGTICNKPLFYFQSLVPIVGEPFDDRLSPNSEQAYFRSRFASEENRELAEVRHTCTSLINIDS